MLYFSLLNRAVQAGPSMKQWLVWGSCLIFMAFLVLLLALGFYFYFPNLNQQRLVKRRQHGDAGAARVPQRAALTAPGCPARLETRFD